MVLRRMISRGKLGFRLRSQGEVQKKKKTEVGEKARLENKGELFPRSARLRAIHRLKSDRGRKHRSLSENKRGGRPGLPRANVFQKVTSTPGGKRQHHDVTTVRENQKHRTNQEVREVTIGSEIIKGSRQIGQRGHGKTPRNSKLQLLNIEN